VGKVRAGEPCAARLILFGTLDLLQIGRPGISTAVDNPLSDGLQRWVHGSQVKYPIASERPSRQV
jgi:hypothetical protein